MLRRPTGYARFSVKQDGSKHNMFTTLKQVTRYEMEGRELLDVIEKETGRRIDGAEIPGDDSEGWLRINVNKDPIYQYDLDQYNGMLAGDKSNYWPDTFYSVYLRLKCQAGLIPEGEYHIHFTWG